MNFLRKVFSSVVVSVGFVAMASLILYPIYKHLYSGLVLVVVGRTLIYLPTLQPERVASLVQRLSAMSARNWLLTLTVLGLAVRIPMIVMAPAPEGDFLIYLQHGQSIAAGHGYGDYLFYPPGQSGWLSVWIRLFGSNIHLMGAVQCLISLATIWVTYAGFVRYSRSAAMWASAVAALFPSVVIWSGTLGHETLVMLLSAIIFWLFGEASERMTVGWWVACGAAIGVVSLVRPTFIAAPILMAACLWLAKHGFWRSAFAGAVIMVSCLAVISPWTWRNYRHLHQMALISTNFGVTMLSSNHPKSDGMWMETMDIGKDLGPVRQDKLQMKLALESIAANPRQFAARTLKRIVYMWGAETSIPDAALGDEQQSNAGIRLAMRLLVQISWVALVFACCLGTPRFGLSWDTQSAPVNWVLVWTGFVFCIHAVLEPAARHHMVLLPLIAGLYLPSYGAWLTREVQPGGQNDMPLNSIPAVAG